MINRTCDINIGFSLTLLGSICILMSSCDSSEVSNQPKSDNVQVEKKTIVTDTLKTDKQDTVPTIQYSILLLNDSIRNQLNQQFDIQEITIIGALNRIDINRLHRTDSLIIPDTFYTNFINYSPFPRHLGIADNIKKLILLSYSLQAFSVYDSGQLIRWGPVSMGKESTPTPIGYFHANWKSKRQISTENPAWILPWYFNIVNSTGVSFHQFELPGFPASHSCIRLREEDAEWIYYYADQWALDKKGWNILLQGTPVIIFGTYNYKGPAPWYELSKSTESYYLKAENIDSVITPYLNQLEQEELERNTYFNDSASAKSKPISMTNSMKITKRI
jgi:hypothetical protein